MSFVTTHPDLLTTAATQWAGLDIAMREENSTLAVSTLGAPPPAADEVSAMTAARFATHAQQYQAIGARAAALQQLFIETLRGNGESYAAAEATNAAAAAAPDPASLTTIAGATQAVGGFVTGPLQATAVVSVITGLAAGSQYLDGVLNTAGAAAVSAPAVGMVSAETPASPAIGPVASAPTSAGTPARPVSARPVSASWATGVPAAGPAPAVASVAMPAGADPLVGQAAAGSLAAAAGAGRGRPTNAPAVVVAHQQPTSDDRAPNTLQQALTEVADEPESVRHWHTDKAHLEDLLDELSATPGRHAVHLSADDVS